MTKRNEKKMAQYINKVMEFSAELQRYFNINGEQELPTIDCTIIGYDPYELPTIKEIKNGFICNLDGEEYEVVECVEDGEIYIDGWEELKEALKYDKRRLIKAWRIYKSENPDLEEERDEEE